MHDATAHPDTNAKPVGLVLPEEPSNFMDSAAGDSDMHIGHDMNWLDMLNDTSRDVNPTLSINAGASGGYGNDTDLEARFLTMTPTSQNTTTMDCSLISATHAFNFIPGFVSENYDPSGPGEATRNIQLDQQHHRHSQKSGEHQNALYNGDDLLSGSTTSIDEHTMSLDQANVSAAFRSSSDSASSEQMNPSKEPIKSPTEMKDVIIQQLSDLSTSLMKDLHRIASCKLASSFLFTHSEKGPAEYFFKTLDGTTNQENAIGRMPEGSEKFLEIMELFKELSKPTPLNPDSSSSEPPLSLSRLQEAFESAEGDSETRLKKRWTILQSYLKQQNPIPTAPNSDVLGGSHKPDITSKLAVLTCYTCLLRIYETVFFVIHHSLEFAPTITPACRSSQAAPSLEINGFMLHKHHRLQIQVLVQVSTYMLESVEKSMHFLLTDATFQALLKAVLQQEGLECSLGNETGSCILDKLRIVTNVSSAGMTSVRQLIEKVKRIMI